MKDFTQTNDWLATATTPAERNPAETHEVCANAARDALERLRERVGDNELIVAALEHVEIMRDCARFLEIRALPEDVPALTREEQYQEAVGRG